MVVDRLLATGKILFVMYLYVILQLNKEILWVKCGILAVYDVKNAAKG